MCRIGAAQFQRGRRAVGLGIAGIGRQFRRDLVGAADHRIEAVERLIAVQQAADLVLQPDLRVVEPAACRDRERLRDIEGVERIDPGILIGGAERDRTDRYGFAGLSEEYAATGDDIVRADGAQFGAGRETGNAGIEASADRKAVIVAEQLIVVCRLQGHSRSRRARCRSINLSQHSPGGERIGELDAVQAIGWCSVVAKAQ